MTTEKMTVHKALCELKTLDSRIQKCMQHARVTLGDMWQQRHNNYGDGYSNIIIHPDGRVSTNWR